MHYSCPCVLVCVSVFWSVICEFIFIAEQILHRQTALPCAVCCSCRRRNTQKVANKAKYPIDSCCACLCTCLYKCINVVNTHTHTHHTHINTHSCCKWLHLLWQKATAIASTIYSNWLRKCLLSHSLALFLFSFLSHSLYFYISFALHLFVVYLKL